MMLLVVGEKVLELLHRYGYGAVAAGVLLENVGIPVPGDTMLLAGASLAQQGHLRLPLVVATGAVAAMLGDNIGFEVGRKLGRRFVVRRLPSVFTEARLARADAFFSRRGALAVFLARFIPGVRVVAAVVAGTSPLPRRTFVLANAAGAVAWATWTGLVGYYGTEAGRRLLPALRGVHLATWLVVAGVLLVAALGLGSLHRHRKQP